MSGSRGDLYFNRMSETFEWEDGRFPSAIETDTPNCYYDMASLSFGGLDPEEVFKRWNYHERLVETLEKASDCLEDSEYQGVRQSIMDLLKELEG